MNFSLVTYLLVVVFSLGSGYLYLSPHWTIIPGKLAHVSVGPAGVWGVNKHNEIYYRDGTYGTSIDRGVKWIKVSGGLKQLDVGTDIVWGVNKHNQIYYRMGISPSNPSGTKWSRVSGRLESISVSENGHVWGVSTEGEVFRRDGASLDNPQGSKWTVVGGRVEQVSVGPSGVWGVDSKQNVLYRTGTYGDDGDTSGTDWQTVEGTVTITYVSSGKDEVWGTDNAETIYRRAGVSRSNPTGDRWEKIDKGLNQLKIWKNVVWGTTTENRILARVTHS